ncbi:McrB family protein [Lysobacter korlensis]|uniref:McrB family protein n=1 Tax=Lysobacter korlensis TaxID=553636 RepID=A0ABV6RXS1_9GAMM
MSDQVRTATRARDALGLLIQNSEPLPRARVWAEVSSRHPLSAAELVSVPSGGATGEVDWNWRTAEFVKAGWLTKGGSDGWAITDAGREAYETWTDPVDLVRESRLLYTAWDQTRTKERASALATRIVPHDAGEEEVIHVAGVFVDRALVAGESVFAPGRLLWTESVITELEQTFVAATTTPGVTFTEQLAVQLAPASDDAKLLMAELVTLQLLPASTDSIGARKKAERVEAVLQLMSHPVQIPEEISAAFASGAFNPGTRMSSNLGAAMTIVVNFAAAWTRTGADHREELLGDPWAFRDFVLRVSGESFPSQRYSLMFLVHPQTFVSIVSDDHKRKIRDAFVGELPNPSGDIDRDLRDITLALQVKNKAPVSYYRPPLREKWQPAPVEEPALPSGEETDPPLRPRASFAAATDQLAADMYIDRQWLQDRLDLLERRRQVILYGPPGTGKTFVAKALARHVSLGADPAVVQFHPSYSYEDFVQGYRPVVEDGALVYRLKDGPFLKIARDARSNPETNYVLVIDEINRGNIAKVFGELYFLLEYRDESIALLYGEERFHLPSNVFIIGTMNTTDRSIALLDAAMRRRFAFVELHPDKEPTSTVLRRWLEGRGLSDEPARLLDALNARIGDPTSRIGPSYLMSADANLSEARLAEIWRYELMPLLEEAYYGEDRDLEAEFGLAALRRSVGVSDADG